LAILGGAEKPESGFNIGGQLAGLSRWRERLQACGVYCDSCSGLALRFVSSAYENSFDTPGFASVYTFLKYISRSLLAITTSWGVWSAFESFFFWLFSSFVPELYATEDDSIAVASLSFSGTLSRLFPILLPNSLRLNATYVKTWRK
jgi:hypothetical protein